MYDKNCFGIMKSREFRTFNKKLGVKQIFAALVVTPKKIISEVCTDFAWTQKPIPKKPYLYICEIFFVIPVE